jgi:hypothetical protein
LNQDGDDEALQSVESPIEDASGDLMASYGFEYDFVDPSAPATHLQEVTNEENDQAYEFRLFAPAATASSKPATTKAATSAQSMAPRVTLLRSLSPSLTIQPQEGRLLRSRPESYYFAKPTQKTQSHFATSTMTTAALQTLTQTQWPGTSLPWRVIHLSTARPSKKASQPSQAAESISGTSPGLHATARAQKRSKPNKKRRIFLRRRLAASTNKANSKPKVKSVTRSETGEILGLAPQEREKRSARNREKKLKRRQRERERKAALPRSAAVDEDISAGDSDGGDST